MSTITKRQGAGETPQPEDWLRLVRMIHGCALAGNGVFAEDDRGRYALTPLGGLLRTDDPGSARALAIYNGDELVWRSWGSLLHSVATGSAAFQRLYAGNLLDLHMLVMLEGGCERTEGEFRTLLAGAGFSLTRVLPANEENSVIEARPV